MVKKSESKYSFLDTEIQTLLDSGKAPYNVSKTLSIKYPELSFDGIREYIKRTNKEQRHTALEEECNAVGIPLENVGIYWHKGKHFSIQVRNKQVSMEDIADLIIGEMKSHAPKYPTIKYPKITDPHLLVISPADIHIGKLCSAFESGDEYNHKIAIDRVKKGVTGIVQKAQPYNIEKILFIIGNDILHTDGAKSTTTSGTFQDTDVMWYDAFTTAYKLYVEVIEMLLTIAPVHIHYNSSNHDFVSGFMLAQSVSSWFKSCKNITFDIDMKHRKYYSYGKNLIGTTHGDGAKETDLALLMAHESKEWNSCPHRYVYMHHIHHKKSKDYMSVCVEALRSASGTDSWHHRNGYQHAPKAIEGFIHHPEYGQITRITHIF